ncbi:MAG: thiamine phosphate synthase [Chloroflexota bacterium]
MDANENRIAEGLRVLEDVARFVTNDSLLTGRLKGLRHTLRTCITLPGDLSARSVEEDVGAVSEESTLRGDLVSVVRANARRVEEALRVVEEMGKLHPSESRPPQGASLNVEELKNARLALYGLEQELVFRLLRRDKANLVRGLYVIIDSTFCGGRGELEVAKAAIAGGAAVLQLRDKQRSKGESLPIAKGLKDLCSEHNVLFIINDHPDLALAAGADGVHLGQKDLPVEVARRILPMDALVGCSSATAEEAIQAHADGADYVAVGSIFPTSSKADTRPAGLETLRKVRDAVALPLVAIGGICLDNVGEVMAAGADAVAVISAVVCAEDVEGAAQELSAMMTESKSMKGEQ